MEDICKLEEHMDHVMTLSGREENGFCKVGGGFVEVVLVRRQRIAHGPQCPQPQEVSRAMRIESMRRREKTAAFGDRFLDLGKGG